MRVHKKKKEICNECEQEFIDQMNRLVGTVDGYDPERHNARQREMDEVFARRDGLTVER